MSEVSKAIEQTPETLLSTENGVTEMSAKGRDGSRDVLVWGENLRETVPSIDHAFHLAAMWGRSQYPKIEYFSNSISFLFFFPPPIFLSTSS